MRARKSGAEALAGAIVAILAGGGVLFAPGSTENAVANGDTRTISLHHAHTKESITATFLVNGQYDSSVLEKLNWFLRDWRRDEATHMDPRLFDVIWEVYRDSGSQQPIEVMSAYRSPETNAMLRRRSRAVAEHSQHILGKAMDQHYVDVPTSRIREIAMRLQRGGVGFYPTAGSPFVHMDVGGVRHWPRMSYDQLARLFPDGKTVHIPSNGQPLPGYEEARAELEARGDSFNYPTATEVKSKGFFAWLFGGEEDEDAAASRDTGRGAKRVASLDRNAAGMAASAPVATTSKDAGVRSFFASSAPVPAPAYVPPPRRVQAAPPPAPPPAPAPAVEEPPPQQARQILAEAMEAERRTRDAAVPPPAAPAAVVAAAKPSAAADATPAPFAPLPPRRPIELASAGPLGAPLPPSRPTELASPTPDRKRDAIGRLIGDTGSSRVAGLPAAGLPAAGLPAAITQGSGGGRTATPAVPVMAYATPASHVAVPALPSRPFVPIPVARPQFVAARLDRSNFRSLTASGTATTSTARTALGSTVGGLRAAAQAKLGAMTAQASSPGSPHSFGRTATDLSSERFSGSAVKPRERVVTSTVATGGKLRSSTE